MKHCEKCEWFGGYTEIIDFERDRQYRCLSVISVFVGINYRPDLICSKYKERKDMNIEEAYKVLQAQWVKDNNVEVGDTVRVLRKAKTNELGWQNTWTPFMKSGQTLRVKSISINNVNLDVTPWGLGYPFFCLEFVKKAEPTIEITCKVNGKVTTLKTLSDETLLRIRDKA